jgi:hypothetical protein
MDLKEALERLNSDAWHDALEWVVINIVIVVFPILITYFFLYVDTGKINFQDPVSHGELSLFSISLLGAGVYSMLSAMKGSLKTIKFPGNNIFYLAIFIEVIIAVSLFVLSFTQNVNLDNYPKIQLIRIIATVIIMVLCFLTTFFIILVDASVSNDPPSAEDIWKRSDKRYQKELSREWRK